MQHKPPAVLLGAVTAWFKRDSERLVEKLPLPIDLGENKHLHNRLFWASFRRCMHSGTDASSTLFNALFEIKRRPFPHSFILEWLCV